MEDRAEDEEVKEGGGMGRGVILGVKFGRLSCTKRGLSPELPQFSLERASRSRQVPAWSFALVLLCSCALVLLCSCALVLLCSCALVLTVNVISS